MKTIVGNIEIRMPLWKACKAARTSEHNADVAALLKTDNMKAQLVRFTDGEIYEALRQRCGWWPKDLKDRATNERRLVWLAAHNIMAERDT